MFQCIVDNEKIETYMLMNESGNTYMKIVPQRGGIVSGFIVNNNKIFYEDNDAVYTEDAVIRAGNPILFPICGGLDDNSYEVNNKKFNIGNHGFARDFQWKVEEVKLLKDSASITISQEWNEKTLKMFPFKYKLIYTYTLTDDSLNLESKFINEDKNDFKFYSGIHPYFYVSDKNNIEVDIPYSSFADRCKNGIIDGKFNFDTEETNVGFGGLTRQNCVLKDKSRNINIKFSDIYKNVVLWALEGKEFVCIEPWMAYVNAMNTGTNLVELKAGKKMKTKISFEVKTI